MPLRFSIVVPTRNRRARLETILRRLEAQTIPTSQFEIIVVDDGSTDDTVDWLSRRNSAGLLHVVAVRHAGPGAARNAGAAAAVGDYLAFTEDDVLVAPDWLERAGARLRRHPVDLLEGRTLLEGTLRSTRRGESMPIPSFIPCNLFVRRAVFEQLGGYDPKFFDSRTGLYFREDADFGFRALEHGFTHFIDQSVLVEHPEQFASVSLCFRHTRRYVFDPLLYRRHHVLYRRYIEVKSLGPFRLHRPLHLACLVSLIGLLVALVGAVTVSPILLVVAAVLVLVAGFGVRVKYQGRRALQIWNLSEVAAFTLLPAVYLATLVRGCRYAGGGFGIFA